MKLSVWCAVLGVVAALARTMTACGGDSSTNDGGSDANVSDAGTSDVAPDVSGPSFSFTISPTSVIVDPGGAIVPVTVNVTRTGGFAEPIGVSLVAAPANVSGSGAIEGTANTGVLNVSAAASATNGQTATATVTATSGTTSVTRTVSLFVRVGHVLLVADATTTLTIPADVTKVTIGGWGAGGGGSCGLPIGQTITISAPGGAGGYAQADFAVTPGSVMAIIVGTGGSGGALDFGGGGGGGYSAVSDADGGTTQAAFYIISGAGAGAGATSSYSQASTGGDGSGADGGNAINGQNAVYGFGGTETGGTNGGAFLIGGNGQSGTPNIVGGSPGGGKGSYNLGGNAGYYGGGGSGYYGGGGGAGPVGVGCGGGGGSGYVRATGTNVITMIGSGATPPEITSPYYVSTVASGGAGATTQNATGNPGAHGRVFVLIVP